MKTYDLFWSPEGRKIATVLSHAIDNGSFHHA